MEIPEINAKNTVYTVSGLGASNWFLQSQFDLNLVTELLGSSPEVGYLAVGAAGILSLSELFELTDVLED
ncbi:hypothetical protein [Halobellus inordinatus]|uniref:hypothetical protein n=1 Tax=Halobellus inordinatus TaxID=1126236 RepID=UPI002113F889|nr:hypothetical protein [Halobellus ramosii]